MTSQARESEGSGYAIGTKLIEQLHQEQDPDARNFCVTGAVVLCANEAQPHDAFAGFARAVVPALQDVPADAKRLATLAARAALAGHQCTRAADGSITFSRWARSVTFDDLAEAEAWLDRVTGKGGV